MSVAPKLIRLGSASAPSWLEAGSIDDAASLEPAPFAADEYERRLRRVRASLQERGVDAVLAFRPSSVDYLCGHHTVETAPQPVLVTEEEIRLYVPDPEVGRALASGVVDVIAHYAASEDALSVIAADAVNTSGASSRIAVEESDATVPPRALALLEQAGVLVIAGDYLVEKLRLILSDAEVRCMEQAANVTRTGADAAVIAASSANATDSDVAGAIGEALHREADSSAAMDVIVATGARGGVPHSTFRRVPLGNGPTFVEFAGTEHRYHAPLMLTLARAADRTAQRLEQLAQTMLRSVLEELRVGRPASDVARSVRANLALEARDIFHFNFGYAVGLAHPPGWLDTAPFSIVEQNHASIQSRMAFHIPASFRSFARAGVGISHTVIVEDEGPRVLTGAEHRAIHAV